jgi:hypothetical protein
MVGIDDTLELIERPFLPFLNYQYSMKLLDHVVIDANGLIIWENVGSYVID